jgi:hypothetical protein
MGHQFQVGGFGALMGPELAPTLSAEQVGGADGSECGDAVSILRRLLRSGLHPILRR